MGNVIKIVNKPGDAISGENVITRLKEALAMAEDGLLENVVMLATLKDGGVMDCWANRSRPFVIIGGLESLKKDFMDRCIEGIRKKDLP